MLTREADILLRSLAKIEMGLARVYEHLSGKPHFSGPVKTFWSSLKGEEIAHEKAFQEIRQEAAAEEALEIEIGIDRGRLEEFVGRVNALLERVKRVDISESEAYSVGALIEAEFDEAHFLEQVRAKDESITRKIRKIENDTKRHRVLLVNYSRGIK